MTYSTSVSVLAILSCTILVARCSSQQLVTQVDDDPCSCDTFTIQHKRDEFVYPLPWLPYLQNKIFFSMAADHDVIISLSKHTHINDPRYLVVFQEGNTNTASIKQCSSNSSSYLCTDKIVAKNSSPFLTNGTTQYYWIGVGHDYSLEVGRGGKQQSFMSFTPMFGTEIGIEWIGLGAANTRVKWEFCNLVLKEIARLRPSYQSSNLYEGEITYDASRANGFDTNLLLPGLCSQTAYIDLEPWWRVDLKADYNVKMVRLWNDITDESHLLAGVTIYVGSSATFTNQQTRLQNKLCGAGAVTKYEAEKDTIIVRGCDYDIGRYVYLVKHTPILKLCGVEVFGYKSNKDAAQETSSCKSMMKNDDTHLRRVILPFVLCILVAIIIAGTAWLFFAYTHPRSSSGILLLKIRSHLRKDAVSSGPVAKYSLVSPSNV